MGLMIALLSAPSSAQWGPLHEVKNYEIAGIRTGMEVSEAIRNLKKFYSIDDESVELLRYQGTEENTGIENPIYLISYTTSEFELTVDIIPLISTDNESSLVVRSITLRMPSSADNKASLLASSIEKYGEPSAVSKFLSNNWSYYWCSEHAEGVYQCADNTPSLQLSHSFITLEDPEYALIWNAYLQQLAEETKEEKPKVRF